MLSAEKEICFKTGFKVIKHHISIVFSACLLVLALLALRKSFLSALLYTFSETSIHHHKVIILWEYAVGQP